ncbi:MAG: DEAD/DEAH box helicase [Patescibacteria group bacterium]
MYNKTGGAPRGAGASRFGQRSPSPRAGGFTSHRAPASTGPARSFSAPTRSAGGFSRGASESRFDGSRGGYGRPQGGGFRGGSRGGFGGGNRGGGRGGFRSKGPRIDVSRFINKAVVTEVQEVFKPEHLFADFKIEEKLKANVLKKGYTTPTPIQDKAIPHVLKGQDVVGIANTGTGKTAAFLIPLINKVILDPKQNCLIMVPTRELAIQIDQELKDLTPGMKIYSVCAVGGAPISMQMRDLRYHNNFIIGTPGRLKDLERRRSINFGEFATVVLDEADRMLDMGFIADMKYVMGLMPAERHTLFFSATMSRDIEVLIKDFLKNPISISVKTGDTSKSVDQDVVRVERDQVKIEVLHDLLNGKDFSKVLIFGRTKHGVEKLMDTLTQKGFKAESIHGDKNHGRRQRALKAFKDNSVQILVATDVAARGLDIPNVTHVINYDLPETYEDYVHRIGRTGRGGAKGKALTFVD